MNIKVTIALRGQTVTKEKTYPVESFEQAMTAQGLAAEDLLGQAVLEVLDKAIVRPEHPKGGEDHTAR